MISKTDLRVGNVVSTIGIVSIVKELLEDTVKLSFIGKDLICTYSSLDPVPLTETVLKNFGFIDHPIWTGEDDHGRRYLCLEPLKMDICTDGGGFFLMTPLVQIESIHQLQNYHYYLLQKEIDVKL